MRPQRHRTLRYAVPFRCGVIPPLLRMLGRCLIRATLRGSTSQIFQTQAISSERKDVDYYNWRDGSRRSGDLSALSVRGVPLDHPPRAELAAGRCAADALGVDRAGADD